MNTFILDGKKLSQEINSTTKERVLSFKDKYGSPPRFDLILVGDKEDSKRYVSSKFKLAKSLNIEVYEHQFKENIPEVELIDFITKISLTSNAILVQLPLVDSINESHVLSFIPENKDPDRLHDLAIKKLETGNFNIENDALPCTPIAIINLINEAFLGLNKINSMKDVPITICGRSKLVGYPLSLLLNKLGAKITICHSKTSEEDRRNMLKSAEIIISAVGKPKLITPLDVNNGTIIIDVGINYDSDGNLVGDTDYHNLLGIAGAITPVPGGVGPMTLAMLMRNVIILSENQKNIG